MLLFLELANLIVCLLVYLLISGNNSLVFERAVAFHAVAQESIPGADHAIREHKLAS